MLPLVCNCLREGTKAASKSKNEYVKTIVHFGLALYIMTDVLKKLKAENQPRGRMRQPWDKSRFGEVAFRLLGDSARGGHRVLRAPSCAEVYG